MHKIPKALYETGHNEIVRRVEALRVEASRLPQGPKRQALLIQAANYSAYADVKRWLAQPQKPRRKMS